MGERRAQIIVLGCLLGFLIATYVVVVWALNPHTPGDELSLTKLRSLADEGRVSEMTVLAYDARISGTMTDGRSFWTGLVDGQHAGNVADVLSSEGAVPLRIDSQTTKEILNTATTWALPIATMVVGFAFLFVFFRGMSGEFSALGKSRARRYSAGRGPRATFADVAGLDEAVEELKEVKDFLTRPDAFLALGAIPPRGILLLGPPGCGKTLLARAVAGEAGVPFFSISASEFVEMLAGVGAARIRDLFDQAREAAPSIVFIDEIDAIGRERAAGHSFNVEWEASLNELLVQLDGFDPSSRVVLMAATNRADILDSALIRKGRFDRHVVVDLPDYAGRMAILKVHARDKRLGSDVDLSTLARKTSGFSGADIASVVNEAALLAARRRRVQIGNQEIIDAIDRVLAGPERRSRVLGDEEKLRVAYHEAGHALVSWALNLTSTVDKVSIVARGRGLGLTWHLATEDRHLTTRSQLEQQIAVLLGGRGAELVVFSDPSDGGRDDLERATRLATAMVCEYGMSEEVGPRTIRHGGSGTDVFADSDVMTSAVTRESDREIERLLREADARARHVLTVYRDSLDLLAERLVERETLERHELEVVLAQVARGVLPPTPKPERTSKRAAVGR